MTTQPANAVGAPEAAGEVPSVRQQRLKSFADRERRNCEPGMGLVMIAECPRCGYLEWMSTYTKEPIGHNAQPLDQCGECIRVYQRAPEIVSWVMDVLSQQKALAEDKEGSTK